MIEKQAKFKITLKIKNFNLTELLFQGDIYTDLELEKLRSKGLIKLDYNKELEELVILSTMDNIKTVIIAAMIEILTNSNIISIKDTREELKNSIKERAMKLMVKLNDK